MSDETVAEKRPLPALVAGGDIRAIIPRDMDELHRVAKGVMVAGIVPDSYKGRNDQETLSKVMIGIQKALEVGLPPLTGLGNIMIVNNRPSIWGDAAIALIQSKNVVDWVQQSYEGIEGADDFTAIYSIKRRGQEHPYEGQFSIADAKRAKLLNKPGPWMTYTKRMLMNRARAYALRDGFADCLSGLSITEEMQDVTPKPTEPADISFLDDVPEIAEAEIVEDETCPICHGKHMVEWQDGEEGGFEPCKACQKTGKAAA